jgi:hypothetical protein
MKGLPKFQSSFRAGLQGALNPTARISFLETYMNELLKPKLLVKLLKEAIFVQFLQLQSKIHSMIKIYFLSNV